MNRETSAFLEQTNILRAGGIAVTCEDEKFILEGGSKSWFLRCVCVAMIRLAQMS